MEKEYITQVNDWLRWYNWHASMAETMPLERKAEFLTKAVHGCVILLAGAVDQILISEQGHGAKSNLLLPVRVKF